MSRIGLPVPRNISPSDDLHKMPSFDRYQEGALTDAQYLHDLGCYLGGLTYEQAKAVHCSILIEPFPGVLEIVENLNSKGIVTGCLSNTNAPHWEDLALSGRFPAIVAMQVRLASFEIDAAKPAAQAYTAFEEAVQAEPSEIILFDDGIANVRAALDLGWNAYAIDPNGNPAGQMRSVLESMGLVQPNELDQIPL